jgi:hypothetical protein
MVDVAGFVPTHLAPPEGLRTWAAPDGNQPTAAIPAGMDVQLAEQQGDWARVVCSNGWSAWVDGRQLIDMGPARAAAESVIDRLSAAVQQYAQVIDDAAAQRIDDAEFRRRAFEAGMIVGDGEDWFLDLPNARWCRYDGFGVTMLGANEG